MGDDKNWRSEQRHDVIYFTRKSFDKTAYSRYNEDEKRVLPVNGQPQSLENMNCPPKVGCCRRTFLMPKLQRATLVIKLKTLRSHIWT